MSMDQDYGWRTLRDVHVSTRTLSIGLTGIAIQNTCWVSTSPQRCVDLTLLTHFAVGQQNGRPARAGAGSKEDWEEAGRGHGEGQRGTFWSEGCGGVKGQVEQIQ